MRHPSLCISQYLDLSNGWGTQWLNGGLFSGIDRILIIDLACSALTSAIQDALIAIGCDTLSRTAPTTASVVFNNLLTKTAGAAVIY